MDEPVHSRHPALYFSVTPVLTVSLLEWRTLPFLSQIWFLALLGALSVFLCLLRAGTCLYGMRAWAYDAFAFLDGAWRVRNGQIPYNDFSTDIGTLVHVLNAFGLILSHGMPCGLAYAQSVMGLAVGIWAYLLSRRRLSPWSAVLMTVMLVLLTISPFDVGDRPTWTSPGMVYNRYGFALVALAMVEAACDRKPATSISEFFGGFSTGAVTILLLFIKISYFLGIGPLLGLLAVCRRQTPPRWFGLAGGSAVVFAPFLIYMRGNLIPMLENLRMLAGAKHVIRGWFITEAGYASALPFVLFAFLACGLLQHHRGRAEARTVLAVGISVTAVGMCFVLANFPGSRLPLNAVAVIIIIDRVEAWFSDKPQTDILMRCAILLWGGLFIFNSLFVDSVGLAYGVWGRWSSSHIPGLTFSEPRLAGFTSFDSDFVNFVNDGLALAQRYRKPGDTIASLDFANPFSYGLGIRPAWGGTSMGLVFDANFDDTHHIAPERLLGHASLLMVPQSSRFARTLAGSIPRIYGPYIQQHFHLVGQTDLWQTYRNNDR